MIKTALPSALALAVIWGGTTAALAEGQQAPVPLDQLIERFNATAPEVEDGVQLDAWVEQGAGGRQLVVLVEPKGETKLIADPGITVTPIEQVGVEWLVPLPHRHVDPAIEYFEPPAAIRLPFATEDARPVEFLVEYAYCVIDYQCFFGEETLTVATSAP